MNTQKLSYQVIFIGLMTLQTMSWFSCHPSKHRTLLDADFQTVDSLCGKNPREALKMIDSIEKIGCLVSEYELMKSVVLRTKAHDKAWDLHTSDSAMKEAVAYFEKHGDAEEVFEAYYYMGSIYRDLHDAPRAVSWFLKASNYGETHLQECDADVLSCVYAQLAKIYRKLYDYKAALEIAKKEYSMSADSLENPRVPMDLATCYIMAEDYDSAFLFYQKSLDIIRQKGIGPYTDIIAAQLSQYALVGIKDEADQRMDMLRQCPEGQLADNVPWSRAIFFQSFSQPDSAIMEFRDELSVARDLGRKANSASHLLRLFHLDGNADSTIKYALLYAALQDSLHEQQKREQTTNILNEFRYRRNKEAEEAAYLQAVKTQMTGWMMMALSLLAITLGIIVFWLYRRYARRMIALREHERNSLQNMWDTEMRVRKGMKVNTSDVQQKLKRIAHRIPSHCPEELWQQAFDAVDKVHPDLSRQLKERMPDISIDDIKLVYLMHMKLTGEEIGALMGCSRMTISRHRRELKARLGDVLPAD